MGDARVQLVSVRLSGEEKGGDAMISVCKAVAARRQMYGTHLFAVDDVRRTMSIGDVADGLQRDGSSGTRACSRRIRAEATMHGGFRNRLFWGWRDVGVGVYVLFTTLFGVMSV